VDFIHAVDPQDHVAIIGSSLGGVAALLATSPLKVDVLVLEAVYPTIEIATRNRMKITSALSAESWRLFFSTSCSGVLAFQLRNCAQSITFPMSIVQCSS